MYDTLGIRVLGAAVAHWHLGKPMYQTHQVCQCGAFYEHLQVEKCCSRPALEALCGDSDLYRSYHIRAGFRRYPLHILLVETRVSKLLLVDARDNY